LLLPVALAALTSESVTAANGRDAFAVLTFILFLAAWVIIPITVSDCVSRERREGTLGLLFLTPLNAREILLGKSTVNIARSLIVFLAAVPILAIPILMGGISPGDILRATFFNGAALVQALAASLLASAVSKQRNRALILSLILSGFFLFGCFLLPITVLLEVPFAFEPLINVIFRGVSQLSTQAEATQAAGVLFVLSLLLLGAVILVCSARLQRNWQDKPMSAKQQKVYNLFCSPRFLLGYFRKWQQHKLTRNPVGWLQSYSWSARVSTWGWCGLIILVESFIVITAQYRWLITFQNALQTALLISIAFSAVNSFQRERQTGALELILVTPIQEKELILGRLRGIWEQFLPAFLVLIFSTWYMQELYSDNFFNRRRDDAGFGWLWSIWQFLSIPVVGLYFGLRFRSMLSAWFLTCACYFLLPLLLHFCIKFVAFRFGASGV
ncbi:MAG: ABC transporter permease subunit, partial [Limisphaerales bacterium]